MVGVDGNGYLSFGKKYKRLHVIGRERLGLGTLHLPEEYWGKRITFKLEVLDGVGGEGDVLAPVIEAEDEASQAHD
jgi:hypothetical protein